MTGLFCPNQLKNSDHHVMKKLSLHSSIKADFRNTVLISSEIMSYAKISIVSSELLSH
ncbi:Uncharacterized protein dnm_074930 [Desulfonema magnum]|uniref:Uncharacterized protein n=1 Tax=Desulfonema magnum TaxID=45655 RepID=A0A975BTK8_9BACT|nr:Uncharacterized protein dnm_074930 [Desulfonema magnum]